MIVKIIAVFNEKTSKKYIHYSTNTHIEDEEMVNIK